MIVFGIIVLLVIGLYLFALGGRTRHPGLSALRGWSYAHRGLHGNGIPENSMAAFRAALEGGYGIEFDVHLMKDGNLAVIHDASLLRTTGKDVRIEDLSAGELASYPLQGTGQTIPLFSQVLELYNGKAPLIIELKPERGNHAALTEAVCAAMEHYPGVYCMESFDPRCVSWLRKNRPEIIRGQLSHNHFTKPGKLPWIIRFLLTHNLMNVATRPDFIAYKYTERKIVSNFLCRRVCRLMGVSWTLQTMEEYQTAVEEGWIPIFEGFTP